MRKFFLEKSYTKCGGEIIPIPFSKKPRLSISLDQYSLNFIQLVFIVCQVEGCQNILKLNCIPLAFTSYNAFPKNKKWSGTNLLTSCSAWLLQKMFLLLYSINRQSFIAWLPLLKQILDNKCIVIVY